MNKIILIIPFLLLLNCTKEEQNLPHAGAKGNKGEQIIKGSVLTAYDSTTTLWHLTTQKMVRSSGEDDIFLSPVDMIMLDSAGNTTTHVTSDSGKTSQAMDYFLVWGRVYITTSEGNTIRSRSLAWDKTKRELHSDDFVEITSSDGQKMRGKGFDAAEDFSWWNFYEEVSGNFPGFEESLGLEE